jgi:hypothetical protein
MIQGLLVAWCPGVPDWPMAMATSTPSLTAATTAGSALQSMQSTPATIIMQKDGCREFRIEGIAGK